MGGVVEEQPVEGVFGDLQEVEGAAGLEHTDDFVQSGPPDGDVVDDPEVEDSVVDTVVGDQGAQVGGVADADPPAVGGQARARGSWAGSRSTASRWLAPNVCGISRAS